MFACCSKPPAADNTRRDTNGASWRDDGAALNDIDPEAEEAVPELPNDYYLKHSSHGGAEDGENRKKKRRGSVSSEATGTNDAEMNAGKGTAKDEQTFKDLVAALKKTFLFQDLDTDQLSTVVDYLNIKDVEAGQEIITQGAPGDFFYVIRAGKYEAVKDGVVVHTYASEGFFGELALMHNAPRAATVRCIEAGSLWALERRTFRSIIVITNKQRRQRNIQILQGMEAFGALSPEQLQSVADCLQFEVFEDGQAILKEGEPVGENSKFYILERGTVTTYRNIAGQREIVKEQSAPSYFGEMAFMEGSGARFADCVAKGPAQVLALERSAFERLMGPLNEVLKKEVQGYKAVNEKLVEKRMSAVIGSS
ncbi:unnamed protein product [Pedinophyceae sp. YPF-701]|nr:unnamed protein product [Pedinophyceae sp. YPF-701]